MIWVVILLCVLCIAMSCVALWYRGKWRDCERSSVSKFDYDMLRHKEEMLRDELKQTDDLCELLRKLNAECNDDKLKMIDEIVKLLGEVEQLRSQLPKRDSKGRYCKREEGI